MPKLKSNAFYLLVLFTAAALVGCSHRPGPRSAYRSFYKARLAGVRVPTYAEIASLKEEPPVQLGQSVQKAWSACLGLALQSKGILGVEDDANGTHRLLLISGETLEYKQDRWVFVDRWLAISMRPISETSTELRVVFVSPKTGRVAPLSADRLLNGFKGGPLRSISLSAKEGFILALTKTLAEDQYLGHLRNVSQRTARGAPREISFQQMGQRELVAQRLGNFHSATLRRNGFVLNMPRVEERIAEVIYNIAVAAKQVEREARIFVVADIEQDAHIEPNGDFFITTKTLDEVKDVDELAGILSHELSHIYLHHGPMRGGALNRAGASMKIMISLGTLGGAVIGGLIPTSKPRSGSPQDATQSSQEAIVGGIVGAGAMLLVGQLGTSVGKDIAGFAIYRFTRKEELEADDYGAELMWAAGYDYRGLLNYLERTGDSRLHYKKSRSGDWR